MRFTASTDVGMRHSQNQDCYKVFRLSDDSCCLVLCDGMGGVSKGGEASFIAVNDLEQALRDSLLDLQSKESVRDFLKGAITRCNKIIYDLARDTGTAHSMGTTVVVAVMRGNVAQIAHVGDSRAYAIVRRQITQLTKDHSVVQELLDSGQISDQQAKNHPNKNIITRALGIDETVSSDYTEVKFAKGDLLLFCTDGLSNMVSDEEIAQISRGSPFYRSAENLVRRAVMQGGFDNVTAVLFLAE